MLRLLLASVVLLSAVPLRAERIRVIVAVEAPRYSATSVASVRTEVMESLATATRIQPWGAGRAFAVEIDRDELAQLETDPRVAAVSLDEGGEGALLQSGPLVGADLVHAQGYEGDGVTVAVLDTGIDDQNPDFAGRIVAQQCFCDNMDGTGCCPNREAVQFGTGAARDDHGHGTHVAGTIASSGASGPRGIAPKARIVAVKVMDESNSFRSFTQIWRALDWIAKNRTDVRVINMSLGSFALYTPTNCGNAAIALGMQDVIGTLRRRGVLITASSGNGSSILGTTLPACMADVIGVGATYDVGGDHTAFCSAQGAHADDVTCFTNSTGSIDLLAPGSAIAASKRGGGSIVYHGTSMAAPHVAGAIALMQQVSGGTLTADQIESILKSTGKPVIDTRNNLTFSRLNVAGAIGATPRLVPGGRRRPVRKSP